MARNRKRAKERRARRPSSAAVAGPRLATAPTERGDGAPNPLEHANPDVELADAQIALGRGEPLDQAEIELEQELLDEDLEEQREERAATAAAVAQPRAGLAARLVGFLQGSWRELQRVQWPDRRQVVQATGVVIGFVIVAGVFLGLADLVAQKIMTFILK